MEEASWDHRPFHHKFGIHRHIHHTESPLGSRMKLLLPYLVGAERLGDQTGASLSSAQNAAPAPNAEMSQALCIVAQYPITDSTSVVWVWHHNEAECTRAMEKLAAACPLAPKSPSCCVEVRWKRDTQNPMVVMQRIIGHWQNKLGSGAIGTSVRSTGMVALFKSIDSAKEALIQAKELLAGDETMSSLTLRSISLNEHVPVPARLAMHGQSTSADSPSSNVKVSERRPNHTHILGTAFLTHYILSLFLSPNP